MIWAFYILIAIAILALAGYIYLCKVPHGWVELRTGIILKFLPSLDDREPVALRRSLEQFTNKRKHLLKVPVREVKDYAIETSQGTLNTRVYDDGTESSRDLILFSHGGGWCVGSINTYEEHGRRIAQATGIRTMVYDYSLAPEHPFPKAHEEGLALAEALLSGTTALDVERLILLGDSAGGNMALSIARSLALTGKIDRVRSVVAVYPVTDASGHISESMKKYSEGYYLTKKAMSNFSNAYSPDKVLSRSDSRFNLLHAEGFDQLPPTFIMTAGFDPLKDEGEAMATKLNNLGVEVAFKNYDSCVHAFFALQDFGKKGLIAVEDVAEFIRKH